MEAQLHTDILNFVLAGRAVFTLRSTRTQNRFTYQVNATRDGLRSIWFVKVQVVGEYKYIGVIDTRNKARGEFRTTLKSHFDISEQPVAAFVWFFRRLSAGIDFPEVEIWHEGKCGRCGRSLTVPESIALGIGPECAERMAA